MQESFEIKARSSSAPSCEHAAFDVANSNDANTARRFDSGSEMARSASQIVENFLRKFRLGLLGPAARVTWLTEAE
jgi:hypothetical protein